MTIVERALEKQRSALPARERRSPRECAALDMASLRTAGVAAPEHATGRLTEQFRRIKWPLIEGLGGRSARPGEAPAGNLLMVASSIAGEGKTFVSFNIALSLAREKDLSVLLVDADVAKGHLTRALNLKERRGLTDIAAADSLDPDELVLATSVPGLTFLPAGQEVNNASELFASQRMAEIVQVLGRSDRQRVVVFDTSPLLSTAEAQILARLVDQIVVVVRAEFTEQPLLMEALSLLDRSKQIRCVLNQTRVNSLSEHYYGYGYDQHGPWKD
jgi:protein-tyrosine kinase